MDIISENYKQPSEFRPRIARWTVSDKNAGKEGISSIDVQAINSISRRSIHTRSENSV